MVSIKEIEYVCIDDDFAISVSKARKIFMEGGVFVYPTDTIYGLGANPFNEEAVSRVNDIKGRQQDKSYILLIDSIDTLLKYVELNSENNIDFLLSIWPNAISVIMNLNQKTSSILNSSSAAFRIPNNRFCQTLGSELKMPIISTSVNRSGEKPLIHPEIIYQEFASEVSGIFYSRKRCFEKASTIIDLTGEEIRLIREGVIKFEDISAKFKQL